MSKKNKKDFFSDPKLVDFMHTLTIGAWKDTLDGVDDGKQFHPQRKEAFYACSSEEVIKTLIAMFEETYKRKLKYRKNGLFYVSYVETEVGEKYDNTVLNERKKD